ncbi:MAG: efflux RND transporter periplasmic adaptor subunit [Casimicrobium sp.]
MTTMTRKQLIIAAVSTLAIAAIGITSVRADDAKSDAKIDAKAEAEKQGGAAAKPSLTVTTTQATQTDWPVKLSANGNIAPWQEAIIGAESNGLRLSEVSANVGDFVKRGQTLAQFSPDTVRADLAQQAAAVAEAEAALAEAEANAARARTLQDSGAMSTQQINQYVTAAKTAAARLQSATAARDGGQLRVNFTRVVAPDDGVISSRLATVGAVVGTGQELFRLIRKNRLEWRAEVTAAELAKVAAGQPVVITTPTGAVVNGKVRVVAPTVDTATRNAIVYVDLASSTAAKAGMFASGDFSVGTTSALSLPQHAVVLRDGMTYVYQLLADNKVSQLKVQTGRRLNDRVEIVSGLKGSETVVVSGAAFLAQGDTVRVNNAARVSAAKP